MNLIAFDTSTPACSVALLVGHEVLTRFDIVPARHGDVFLPWLEELLAEAGINRLQLDAIGVTIGPGTFTGVRLGISIAQGFALGLNRPIIPLSTLQLLAMQIPANGKTVLACIDARMGEVYSGWYQRNEDGMLCALMPETVSPPESVRLPDASGDWYALGSGLTVNANQLAARLKDRCVAQRPHAHPNAAHMLPYVQQRLQNGLVMDPAQIEPMYLRQRVALTRAERRAAAATIQSADQAVEKRRSDH